MTALVELAAGALQHAALDRFPALIAEFLCTPGFGYDGAAVLRDDRSAWRTMAKAGSAPAAPRRRAVGAAPWDEGEVLYTRVALAGCPHVVAVTRATATGFSEHERSFFPLFASLIRAMAETRVTARQLEVARSDAEAASHAKSAFLANMSHEIRTPIHGVLGMLELLARSNLDAEQRELLGLAVSSSRNLLAIVNDILDISRIEAGKLEINPEEVDLVPLFENVVRSFAPESAVKRVEIAQRLHPDLPARVITDPVRVRQILINLVSNALKFTEQGRITLEAWHKVRPAGMLALYVSVADTGVGVPPDKLDSIFEAFTQVDASSTRRFQGSGLGLSIVKHLVTQMGGNIAVASREGAGTTVTFHILVTRPRTVPASAARILDPREARRGEGAALPPLRILVVEDQEINQLVARRLLERAGHEVTLADSGQRALEVLRVERFDCVLMDIQMPEMDGIETTRRIRRMLPDGIDLPIIALTAHAMKGDRDRFLAHGMNGYITKPFDGEALQELLREVVGDRAPLRPPSQDD